MTRRGVAPISMIALLLAAGLVWDPAVSSGQSLHAHIEVSTLSTGGQRVEGTFPIAAEPEAVHRVLTDFKRWPELFDTPIRVSAVTPEDDRVVTEVFIRHSLLFGERRLLCENRIVPGGGLRTKLLEGDFRQYERVWRIQPVRGGKETRAVFDMVVEVDTWAPDWLVRWMLRREIVSHFGLVKQRAEKASRLQ